MIDQTYIVEQKKIPEKPDQSYQWKESQYDGHQQYHRLICANNSPLDQYKQRKMMITDQVPIGDSTPHLRLASVPNKG